MNQTQAGNSDYFFRYDAVPNRELVEAEISQLLVQRKRKLFYNRSWGCGIPEQEQLPNIGIVRATIGFDVVSAIALRNTRVTDGQNGVDRRAFASQQTVNVEQKGADLAVEAGFIMVGELSASRTGAVVPWGRR